jgi:hypothetical protein
VRRGVKFEGAAHKTGKLQQHTVNTLLIFSEHKLYGNIYVICVHRSQLYTCIGKESMLKRK